MKRQIVRAALYMEEVEIIGEFSRAEDEEYGEYVCMYQQDEAGFIAEINEYDGSLEEFESIEECIDILSVRKNSYEVDIWKEIDQIIELVKNRFE